MHRLLRSLGLGVGAMLVLAGAVAAEKTAVNGIAAIANNAIITRQEVDELARPSIDSLARALLRKDPALFERRAIEVWTDALDHLIERQLILDDFKTSGLVFPEKWIDEQINDIIRNKYGDRVALGKSLQAQGLTFATFRDQQRDNLIIRAMESRNIREATFISPAKIQRYYQTNLANYKLDDQVKLRVIALDSASVGSPDDTRQLALEILKKIGDGADFAQMAAVNSIPPTRNAGDWGWLERSKMSKSFGDLADRLQPGQHSGVISEGAENSETAWVYFYDATGRITKGRKYSRVPGQEAFLEEKEFGAQAGHEGLPTPPQRFFVVKVEERKIAHTRPLDDVRDEIERELLAQERARLRKQWIERLKAKSFVRRY